MRRIGKHINPASVLALVALVFAVTGGAYAASGSGSGSGSGGGGSVSHATARVAKSKKKPVSSGKPGPRGPQGPAGPVGVTGAAGPAGPAGPAGSKGETGSAGSNGLSGSSGESVKVAAASNSECPAGGAKLSNGTGSEKVCDGAEGEPGPKGATGSPWSPENKLPAGATETGAWEIASSELVGKSMVNFPIEVSPAITAAHVVVIKEPTEEQAGKKEYPAAPTGCKGNADEPGAEKGYLCLFIMRTEKGSTGYAGLTITNMSDPGNDKSGVPGTSGEVGLTGLRIGIRNLEAATEETHAIGTWAVTAE